MLFNSIDFAIFLPIVFVIYWFVLNKNLMLQNLFIVAASYLFYGWWDWRFLSLIFFSTVVDFFVGIKLKNEQRESRRKTLLCVSMITNLGFLGFFKYYNFFLDNFITAFSLFGTEIRASSLDIILPVGISFYTFQTMSYTIDVYKRKLKPTSDFIAFSAFVSFFPQLVAGPIERATHLLPQFYVHRLLKYEELSSGLKLILWGLFMKMVVADRVALYVDDVYGEIAMHSGTTLIVATVFFAIQIYCDFGGYSLIATGTAKLFGFDLMVNFRRPYFAISFKDFWSRWHISLSTWFRDYVYIPLGGNKKGNARTYLNLITVFVVSGFWHGANWTFIIWGALHGFYQIVERLFNKVKLPRLAAMALVFALTCFAWIFFRAASAGQAFEIINRIVTNAGHGFYVGDIGIFLFSVAAILLLLLNDFIVEYYPNMGLLTNKYGAVRYASIAFIILYIVGFGVFDSGQFIYFQF